jgi:hypothetical protein
LKRQKKFVTLQGAILTTMIATRNMSSEFLVLVMGIINIQSIIIGRNLLNKKDVPPSTIKESSESSQTIDEPDGVGSSGADKGEQF